MGRARACTPLLAKLNKCLIEARAGASRRARGRLTTRHGLRLLSNRLAPSWRGAVLPGRGPQDSGERLHWGPTLSPMGPIFWEGPVLATLIILTWVSGYVSGPIATSVEFSSLSRCEASAETIRREAKGWDVSDSRIHVFCIMK